MRNDSTKTKTQDKGLIPSKCRETLSESLVLSSGNGGRGYLEA